MVTAWQGHIDGWRISGRVDEYKPDGWRHGEPTLFSIQAIAELSPHERHMFKEGAPDLLRYPRNEKMSIHHQSGEGRSIAMDELKMRIEALRR